MLFFFSVLTKRSYFPSFQTPSNKHREMKTRQLSGCIYLIRAYWYFVILTVFLKSPVHRYQLHSLCSFAPTCIFLSCFKHFVSHILLHKLFSQLTMKIWQQLFIFFAWIFSSSEPHVKEFIYLDSERYYWWREREKKRVIILVKKK